MKLSYTDPRQRMIKVELEDDDTLGHHHGPSIIFVPTDPGNREYREILEREHTVEEYRGPEIIL